MSFDEIFESYYNLYRAEAEIPNSEDDEYPIAIRLANEAINRWANYDNTMWQELFQTLQAADDGDTTITSATTEYAAPADMRVPGGNVLLLEDDGSRFKTLDIVPTEEVQFFSDVAEYAYFTGNPNTGYTLHINPSPVSTWVGKGINYVYYKKPVKMVRGNSKPDMGDPYFIVHRMLANRFRASRNPYYNSAKADAEDSLRTMQLTNNSGNWANPWSVPDRSGTQFGG